MSLEGCLGARKRWGRGHGEKRRHYPVRNIDRPGSGKDATEKHGEHPEGPGDGAPHPLCLRSMSLLSSTEKPAPSTLPQTPLSKTDFSFLP